MSHAKRNRIAAINGIGRNANSGATASTSPTSDAPPYERHRPEQTPLYALVEEHFPRFFERLDDEEKIGFPTQKPLALLRRIVTASSGSGQTVLDPFAGCATACLAAEQLGRAWVGFGVSPKAGELVAYRMRNELGLFYEGAVRTDLGFVRGMGACGAVRISRGWAS